MTQCPLWLPEIICVDGEWQRVLAALYAIFESDIKRSGFKFAGRPVWYDRRVLPGERYEEGFWHLTSRDGWTYDKRLRRNVKQRVWDPRRSERLPWCRPTLEHSGDSLVTVWDYKEANGHVRTYLWLKDLNYVIILERQQMRLRAIFMLITAFYVDCDAKKRDMEGRYLKRVT